MPRATKDEKFSIINLGKSVDWKGRALIYVNRGSEGDINDLSLQDLLDFLKNKNIDPSVVAITKNFSTDFKIS